MRRKRPEKVGITALAYQADRFRFKKKGAGGGEGQKSFGKRPAPEKGEAVQ